MPKFTVRVKREDGSRDNRVVDAVDETQATRLVAEYGTVVSVKEYATKKATKKEAKKPTAKKSKKPTDWVTVSGGKK